MTRDKQFFIVFMIAKDFICSFLFFLYFYFLSPLCLTFSFILQCFVHFSLLGVISKTWGALYTLSLLLVHHFSHAIRSHS